MHLTGKEDVRVQKTIETIHGTFSDLLMEGPYEKITVAELCRRARINKKTFYRYYSDLDNLLEEVQEAFFLPYVERTRGMRYPQDLEEVTRDFMLYSAEQGPLYDRMVCTVGYEAILGKIISGMEDDRFSVSTPPKGWQPDEWSLYMTHVTAAQLRLYRQWVEDGKTVPIERMADIACKLICKGAEL